MVHVYFDTSGLNQLLDDPSREVLVEALTKHASVRISAINIVEALKTASSARRTALLTLMNTLTGGASPMDFPNTIVRGVYRTFARRFRWRKPMLIVNRDPDGDDLQRMLLDPTAISDEDLVLAAEVTANREATFDQMVFDGREDFQELLAQFPRLRLTASDTMRSCLRNRETLIEAWLARTYRTAVGKELSREEAEDLLEEPMLVLYMAAFGYGMHLRSIQRSHYSRGRNAGGMDLAQAVYLRLCDRFVTHDQSQYRALRFLARFVRHDRPVVQRYRDFKRAIVREAPE